LSNRGRILRIQGRYAEAESFIRRALDFAEQRFGADSLTVAWALNDLGMLGKFGGWFDQSEACYRRALEIVEKHFGHDSPELASLYHNLGGLEHARGRYEAGEPFARKSVELRERALGPDHTDVAADLAALAALLEGQGKLDEAERLDASIETSARHTAKSITRSQSIQQPRRDLRARGITFSRRDILPRAGFKGGTLRRQ
jgi:tetratricopeptide (TPR) repeat protein